MTAYTGYRFGPNHDEVDGLIRRLRQLKPTELDALTAAYKDLRLTMPALVLHRLENAGRDTITKALRQSIWAASKVPLARARRLAKSPDIDHGEYSVVLMVGAAVVAQALAAQDLMTADQVEALTSWWRRAIAADPLGAQIVADRQALAYAQAQASAKRTEAARAAYLAR